MTSAIKNDVQCVSDTLIHWHPIESIREVNGVHIYDAQRQRQCQCQCQCQCQYSGRSGRWVSAIGARKTAETGQDQGPPFASASRPMAAGYNGRYRPWRGKGRGNS
jgi:hypothetical protein